MDQHPYYQLLATCLVVMTIAAVANLAILGFYLWTRYRASVESRRAAQLAYASFGRFEQDFADDLAARRKPGGQSA
jgi:hypothetical protein